MNESMRPADLLRSAAALIERAHGGLDGRGCTCDCCGQKAFRNMTHARIRERIDESPAKLRKMADELDRAEGRKEPLPRPLRRGDEERT